MTALRREAILSVPKNHSHCHKRHARFKARRVFDRLDADIAKAIMSINAGEKALEIGDVLMWSNKKGSEHRRRV